MSTENTPLDALKAVAARFVFSGIRNAETSMAVYRAVQDADDIDKALAAFPGVFIWRAYDEDTAVDAMNQIALEAQRIHDGVLAGEKDAATAWAAMGYRYTFAGLEGKTEQEVVGLFNNLDVDDGIDDDYDEEDALDQLDAALDREGVQPWVAYFNATDALDAAQNFTLDLICAHHSILAETQEQGDKPDRPRP